MKEINLIIEKLQLKRIEKIEKKLKSKDKILVGKTIKFYRLYYNIPQRELARKLWTSFQVIQKYERGKLKINAFKLLEICRVIGVSAGQFIDSVDNVEGMIEILNNNS